MFVIDMRKSQIGNFFRYQVTRIINAEELIVKEIKKQDKFTSVQTIIDGKKCDFILRDFSIEFHSDEFQTNQETIKQINVAWKFLLQYVFGSEYKKEYAQEQIRELFRKNDC